MTEQTGFVAAEGAGAAVAQQTVDVFGEDVRRRAAEIIERYPQSRSALLPMLHLVQSVEGYVSPRGVAFCAEQLGITKAQVGAVATFYTMYKRRATGDWLVSVCTNTMCGVLGGDRAYQALSEYLGVGHDQTTTDGKITLEHAECLAACDYAPVMTVNYEFFDQVDAGSALEIVRKLQAGERPAPTRGARLCTLKEMSAQLAGWGDERDGALADGSPGEPTLAGNRLAAEHGVAVAGFDPATPIASPQASAPIGRSGDAPIATTPPAKPAAEKPAATKSKPAGKAAAAPAPAAPAASAPPAEPSRGTAAPVAEEPKTAVEPEPADAVPEEKAEPVAAGSGDAAASDAEPFGEGSARATADGSGPGGYTIKGNENSFLYHAPESPHYKRTKPEVWFRTAADAQRAGFTPWNAPAAARTEAKARAKERKQRLKKGGGK